MEQVHGVSTYATSKISDENDGCVGIEVQRGTDEPSQVVARIVFWDAEGQFSVETMGEVPLSILESAIAEARKLIGE
jgi:hypothetical protein